MFSIKKLNENAKMIYFLDNYDPLSPKIIVIETKKQINKVF